MEKLKERASEEPPKEGRNRKSGAEGNHFHVIFITSYFKNSKLTDIKIQHLFFDLEVESVIHKRFLRKRS